jgi:hypothetical protein
MAPDKTARSERGDCGRSNPQSLVAVMRRNVEVIGELEKAADAVFVDGSHQVHLPR